MDTDSNNKTEPQDDNADCPRKCINIMSHMWALVEEEYRRRGAPIPEFDRTQVHKIRLSEDV
jgi:hypothetical protein